MLLIEDNFYKNIPQNTYIALGSFDGIHLGHKALIEKTMELSQSNSASSMVYTFKNHPISVINEEMTPKLLMDNDYKLEILESFGIEIVNLAEFNTKLMSLSPEEFIKNIISFYNAKGLIVGFNYRFGYKNLGNTELLLKFSKSMNFELYITEVVKYKGETVSSSKIRNLISEGEIAKANKLLGRPFMISGKIIKGKQLGRTIGFPTINLDYNKLIQIPSGGVYYTVVECKHKKYKGITNVGYNPTVDGKKLNIETNILDFNENVYGEYIRIFFKNKFRDEKKFDSIEELKCQLKKDRNYARRQEIF